MSETEVTENVESASMDMPFFERDPKTGLVKGVQYKYKDEYGVRKIDWRAMIKPEHIVINRAKKAQIEKVYGKPIDELVPTELDDKYLLILIAGIKDVAALRGFKRVIPAIMLADQNKCVVKTEITWIPNIESGNESVCFGDVGAAGVDSVAQNYIQYMETIAANRAFVRAVRNFLGIHIVGSDEIKPSDSVHAEDDENVGRTIASIIPKPAALKKNTTTVEQENESSSTEGALATKSFELPTPQKVLKGVAAKLNLDFSKFKANVIKKYKDKVADDIEEWKDFDDVSSPAAIELSGILKEALEKKIAKEQNANQ